MHAHPWLHAWLKRGIHRPTPSHASILTLAEEYWGGQCKLQPILDDKVEWNDDIVVELTLYSEHCLEQPNRRPEAKKKLVELERLQSRIRGKRR